MKCAVVGHVEWIEFAEVESVPATGQIGYADRVWCEAAGGGAVAAVQMSRLGADTTLFTSLGDDHIGARSRERLEGLGLRVQASLSPAGTRRGFTFLDAAGERTITVFGPKPHPSSEDSSLPWEELADADAVYFTAGDPVALRRAREARTLVATSRELETLAQAGVELDALVGSGADAGEAYEPGSLDPPPKRWVVTDGPNGGAYAEGAGETAHYAAADLPGPVRDAYGCGDSFAAGFTFGLGEGRGTAAALELGALCGATCLTGAGPYGNQLTRLR
ncbi:MAG: ribokinase [Thermoleophilaceae bacterium]|nr:ribokinase [Thermoleophilaceae bacterium]